jgi:2-amino-4-hydroxy-6-hydroxymethyldihydropteridine diphosphokinase
MTERASAGSSSSLNTVVVGLGSNLGDRPYNIRRALEALGRVMRVVRVSALHETEPVDAPAASPRFLNGVVVGYTLLGPEELLAELQAIEKRLGRAPRRVRNEPRVIDLDLVLYGARRMRTGALTLPHPRAHGRAFVLKPLREVTVPAISAFLTRRPLRR